MATPVTDAPLYEVKRASKIFSRGGTEVRAVDNVSVTIAPASSSRSKARAAPARPPSSSSSARSTVRPAATSSSKDATSQALRDNELAELRLRAFGFVFQHFNLIPTLTAVQNVEVALAPTGVSGTELRDRSLGLLKEVGLAERASHLPSQMSGGEQQRVAIARALVVEPRVILADEPTGNLDTKTGADVIDLLSGLAAQHGSTIVVATHDAGLAARAPRRLAMRDGAFVDAASPELAAAGAPVGLEE